MDAFEEKIYSTLVLILSDEKCEKSDQYRVKTILHEIKKMRFMKKVGDLDSNYSSLRDLET